MLSKKSLHSTVFITVLLFPSIDSLAWQSPDRAPPGSASEEAGNIRDSVLTPATVNDAESVVEHGEKVTPEQFGAKPDNRNHHQALARMFSYLDSKGGGVVVLSPGPGAYVFEGDITVSARVSLTGRGTLKIDRASTPSVGLKFAGDYSRIESGVTLDGGRNALTIVGDHIFADATVVNSEGYAFDIYGDYCVIGTHAKAVNAGYAGMRLFALRALNRLDVHRFESIDHVHKGFVYNGKGGIKEINIGSLRAVTTKAKNTPKPASDGLLIDSGEPSGATIRVGHLRVGDLHVEGHRSNGFKIHNTGRIELGTVYNRNAAIATPTSSGGRIGVNSSSSLTWESMDTDNVIRIGGDIPDNARFGRVSLVGDHPPHAIVINGRDYNYSFAEVHAQSLTPGKSVFWLRGGAPERLVVGKVFAPVETFRISECIPGTITVAETIGFAGPSDGIADCRPASFSRILFGE